MITIETQDEFKIVNPNRAYQFLITNNLIHYTTQP